MREECRYALRDCRNHQHKNTERAFARVLEISGEGRTQIFPELFFGYIRILLIVTSVAKHDLDSRKSANRLSSNLEIALCALNVELRR